MLILNRLNRYSILLHRCSDVYCFPMSKEVRKPSVNPTWTDFVIYGMAILDVNRIEALHARFLTL